MDASGGSAARPKRKKWKWKVWLDHYFAGGALADEFAGALQDLLQVLRRSHPDNVYGPWDHDRRYELFANVMHAIAGSQKLREYLPEWDDVQIFGYVRRIMENEIQRMREKEHPAWFWMFERIHEIAKKKRLALVDNRRWLFIPTEWLPRLTSLDNGPEHELLEERLAAVPHLMGPRHQRIRLDTIETTVDALFQAAQSPISLKDLISHCLRVLGIRDICLQQMRITIDEDGEEREQEIADTEVSDPAIELTIWDWVADASAQLSVEQMVVLWSVVRDQSRGTFDSAARHASTLLKRSMSTETARKRYHEAVSLMRVPSLGRSFSPATQRQGDIFLQILLECIEQRLRDFTIDVGVLPQGGTSRN